MKLLFFFAKEFKYRPFKKVLQETAQCSPVGETFKDVIVIFFHFEKKDVTRASELKKCIKNIKWIASKFSTKSVVFHSFNHLSFSKAYPEFGPPVISEIKKRLGNSGYKIGETPYGYLNEWSIHVAGESLAKVFKDL